MEGGFLVSDHAAGTSASQGCPVVGACVAQRLGTPLKRGLPVFLRLLLMAVGRRSRDCLTRKVPPLTGRGGWGGVGKNRALRGAGEGAFQGAGGTARAALGRRRNAALPISQAAVQRPPALLHNALIRDLLSQQHALTATSVVLHPQQRGCVTPGERGLDSHTLRQSNDWFGASPDEGPCEGVTGFLCWGGGS